LLKSNTYGVLGDLFPAASNFKNVLGVAAVDSDGRRATFSNYGTRTVDVAAPGVEVYGPYPGGTGMATWSGTSFSAGFVSGEVALALEKYGSGPKAAGAATWTANQVLGIDPDSEFMGSGLIDAVGAVTLTADSEAFDTVWDGKMSASTSDGSTITGSGVESIGGPNTGTPADPPVDDKHKGKKSRVERFTDRIGRYMDRITTAAAKIETAYADGKEKKAYRYQSRINKLMSAIQKLVAKIEKYEGEG